MPKKRVDSKKLMAAIGDFAARMRHIDWVRGQRILDSYKAAKLLPDDHRAKGWAELGHLTPRQIDEHFSKYLPDPLGRGRGRPKGGPIATDQSLFDRLTACEAAGERPTTALRRLLPGRTRGQIDHVVRLWRKRAK
jgi:hypothetical protein